MQEAVTVHRAVLDEVRHAGGTASERILLLNDRLYNSDARERARRPRHRFLLLRPPRRVSRIRLTNSSTASSTPCARSLVEEAVANGEFPGGNVDDIVLALLGGFLAVKTSISDRYQPGVPLHPRRSSTDHPHRSRWCSRAARRPYGGGKMRTNHQQSWRTAIRSSACSHRCVFSPRPRSARSGVRAGARSSGESAGGKPPVAVEVAVAGVDSLAEALDVVGSLTPKLAADIRSEVSGTVLEDRGDRMGPRAKGHGARASRSARGGSGGRRREGGSPPGAGEREPRGARGGAVREASGRRVSRPSRCSTTRAPLGRRRRRPRPRRRRSLPPRSTVSRKR